MVISSNNMLYLADINIGQMEDWCAIHLTITKSSIKSAPLLKSPLIESVRLPYQTYESNITILRIPLFDLYAKF